ncbi:MAG: ABC transporter permease, partial [Clostridia bacterium]|nr:ABC transporter permease [Clostridia bacterium]
FRAADYDTDSQYRLNESNKTELIATVAGIASIILLLFCIAASLVNNALTAKIREGKREIGTLRAVGASTKELTMIYIHQLLSTFGMGCGLGFGIYTAVFFSAKLICLYYLHMEFPFEFRILTAVVICIVLFAVCSLNLYSKIKKQMKYSIVENIREL